MKIAGYLKEKQPILYRTFANAMQNNTVTHSYLIVGEAGTPLLETATYLAKSLLCDHPDPLAD
jgi:DNA polymerase-3 subunit delta'